MRETRSSSSSTLRWCASCSNSCTRSQGGQRRDYRRLATRLCTPAVLPQAWASLQPPGRASPHTLSPEAMDASATALPMPTADGVAALEQANTIAPRGTTAIVYTLVEAGVCVEQGVAQRRALGGLALLRDQPRDHVVHARHDNCSTTRGHGSHTVTPCQ
jgi:hypothetical protein